MAEFSEVMKQYDRMCETVYYCENCPMYNVDVDCERRIKYPKNFENIVMQWAEDNPPPEYMTWGDWFASRKDLIKNWRDIKTSINGVPCMIGFLYESIPEDIAEKLGIDPMNSGVKL